MPVTYEPTSGETEIGGQGANRGQPVAGQQLTGGDEVCDLGTHLLEGRHVAGQVDGDLCRDVTHRAPLLVAASPDTRPPPERDTTLDR